MQLSDWPILNILKLLVPFWSKAAMSHKHEPPRPQPNGMYLDTAL